MDVVVVRARRATSGRRHLAGAAGYPAGRRRSRQIGNRSAGQIGASFRWSLGDAYVSRKSSFPPYHHLTPMAPLAVKIKHAGKVHDVDLNAERCTDKIERVGLAIKNNLRICNHV